MKTTNVKASNLNYDHYETDKYDNDIERVIPGHKKMHKEIEMIVKTFKNNHVINKIADLGTGTGLTAEMIMKLVPNANLTANDFSKKMIMGAKNRLSRFKVDYVFGDFSEINIGKNFDIILTVIGLHHQNTEGKKKVLKKIFNSLNEGGLFILGDLVTYKNKQEAALNDALHFAHMVRNAEDEKSLKEWAYHHKFLNDLAPMEDQIKWLKEAGFKRISVKYQYLNTALIIAYK